MRLTTIAVLMLGGCDPTSELDPGALIGRIDEVRIYATAISDTQIQLEHKNLTDPTFITSGPEEAP